MLDAVQEVATVVHYQLPASADMYVHRSGRTGRAGTEGTSIALVTPRDAPRFAALLQVGAHGWIHSGMRCLACMAVQDLHPLIRSQLWSSVTCFAALRRV